MLLDEYGVAPWQMEQFTGHELTALERYHNWKVQQSQQEGG